MFKTQQKSALFWKAIIIHRIFYHHHHHHHHHNGLANGAAQPELSSALQNMPD